MQATPHMASIMSSTLTVRRRLILDVKHCYAHVVIRHKWKPFISRPKSASPDGYFFSFYRLCCLGFPLDLRQARTHGSLHHFISRPILHLASAFSLLQEASLSRFSSFQSAGSSTVTTKPAINPFNFEVRQLHESNRPRLESYIRGTCGASC
jgi:hypothetical protein